MRVSQRYMNRFRKLAPRLLLLTLACSFGLWVTVDLTGTATKKQTAEAAANSPVDAETALLGAIEQASSSLSALTADHTPIDPALATIGDHVLFQLPDGHSIKGSISKIQIGENYTRINGNLDGFGFFVFSYGPSKVFGSVTSQWGSFEYRGDAKTGQLVYPSPARLDDDVLAEPAAVAASKDRPVEPTEVNLEVR